MQDVKDRARMVAASMAPAPRAVKRLPDRRRAAETGGVAGRCTPSQGVACCVPAFPGVAILSPQSARPAPPPAWRRALNRALRETEPLLAPQGKEERHRRSVAVWEVSRLTPWYVFRPAAAHDHRRRMLLGDLCAWTSEAC